MVIALVLASATTASAECAWVLWQQERIMIPPRPLSAEWSPPVAFVDRAACGAWIERNVAAWEKGAASHQSVTCSAGGMAAEFRTQGSSGPGSGLTTTFRCLPDTVDPRGAKGK